MKSKILWILAIIATGLAALSSCKSKKEVYDYSSYRSAISQATTVAEHSVEEPIIVIDPDSEIVAETPDDEEVIFVTDEDIEKFEKELRFIMGETSTGKPTAKAEKPKKETTKTVTPAKPAKPAVAPAGRYLIVTGSFSTLENAKKHVSELVSAGYTAGIPDETATPVRVYAYSGADKAVALDKLETIRERFPSAWLLINKK